MLAPSVHYRACLAVNIRIIFSIARHYLRLQIQDTVEKEVEKRVGKEVGSDRPLYLYCLMKREEKNDRKEGTVRCTERDIFSKAGPSDSR